MKKRWETVIDFTKIRKGGVPIAEVLAAFEKTEKKKLRRRVKPLRNITV